MDICLIWANAHTPLASRADSLSWLGAEDVRRFESVAERHPVVMGRATWEAIPKAFLTGRQIFVLTQRETSIPGAVACTSLTEALTLASVLRSGKLFLLGGAALHEQSLRVADRLYVAHLNPDAQSDCPLPDIDPRHFELVREDRMRTMGPSRLFQEYRRRRYH